MVSYAAANYSRRASSARRISTRDASNKSPKRRVSSLRSSSSSRGRRQSSSNDETKRDDSEYGMDTSSRSPTGRSRPSTNYAIRNNSNNNNARPSLSRHQQKMELMDETQRKFEAMVIFKEYCLYDDKKRMQVDQLRPYMARLFDQMQASYEEEPVKLVLEEAIKRSMDEPEGILNRNGVVSAVIKYDEYAKHCDKILTIFRASDSWSDDGIFRGQQLRKLIQNYEETQHRCTEYVQNVLLFVTEEDLNFILEMADLNKDGGIDATEVVKAIGAWEELASIKMKDFEKMNIQKCWNGGCTIS